MKIRTKAIMSALIIFFCSAIGFVMIWILASGIYDTEYYFNDKMDNRHLKVMEIEGRGIPNIGEALCEENAVHVKFIEKKHCIDGRTKFVFEVIEWINSNGAIDTSTKRVTFYSKAYPLKYKSQIELYGIHYGYTYEPGKEYVIISPDNTLPLGYFLMYIPLSDITKMHDGEKSFFECELDTEIEKVEKEDLLQALREWIAENKEAS